MSQNTIDCIPNLISIGSEIEKIQDDVKSCTMFDKIVGLIEDILIKEEFQELQENFLNKYWSVFEPIEENKLIYMEAFSEYNKTIEKYIENNLKKEIPNFSMDEFITELHKRRSDLDGEVFDVLLTFTDFLAFKELILDYRAVQEGKVQDLSIGISVKSFKIIQNPS